MIQLPGTGVVKAKVRSPQALRQRLGAALRQGHAAGWRFTGPPMIVVPPSGPRLLAIPVAGRPSVSPPFSFTLRLPTRAAVETATGPLPEVETRARAMRRQLAAHGLKPAGPLVLELVDDPGATPPSRRRTRIVIPLK